MPNKKTGWLAGLILPLVGCVTAERIEYVHAPTAKLHKGYDLSDDALKPFTRDGVVFSPFFKLVAGDQHKILFDVVAPTRRTVAITGASLHGTGPARDLGVDLTVTTKDQKQGALVGSTVLGTVSNAELEALAEGGSIRLDVRLKLDNDKKPKAMDFTIERRSTQQMVP